MSPASAQEIVLPSVAWATAEADVVVAGVVLGWSPPPPTSDQRPPGTRQLTVGVAERLKGTATDTLEVVATGTSWAAGTPVVVFARYEPVGSICGPDPETGVTHTSPELRSTHLVAGSPDGWTLIDRGFVPVRDGETLLAQIRSQARVPDHGGLVLARAPARGPIARPDGVPVFVALPADAVTEAWALGALADPDPERRAAGIGALRRFESTAHIERLLGLAGQPDAVGRAAREVLEAWAVPLR
jgi:hypothetical protein